MRKKLFICVMAAALFLSACSTNPDNPTKNTTAPSLTTLPAQPTQPTNTSNPAQIIDSTYTASDDMAFFAGTTLLQQLQVSARKGEAFSVRVQRTNPDRTKTNIQIQYDPEEKAFTYQADGESLTFSHLIATRHAAEFGTNFYELFLLSNKPDATYADALGANPSAVVVYANYVELADLVESYGTVPSIIRQSAIGCLEFEQGVYLEKSFFLIDSKEDDLWFPTSKPSLTLYRYDYSGNLLCTAEVPQTATSAKFCELSDGGFLMTYNAPSGSFTNGPTLACYSSDGALLWTCSLPLSSTSPQFPCVMENAIYCFGVVEDTFSNRNIAVVKLSMDGALLAEKQFTGDNSSILYGVEVQESGIRIYGGTSNTIGDFPYLGDFQAYIDSELNIISGEKLGDRNTNKAILGYLGGKAVWSNDPIFNYQTGDALPLAENLIQPSENVTNLHIFSTGFGYVIIRKYTPDADLRSPSGFVGGQYSYSQLIFTGYSISGAPRWQRVTPIYLSRQSIQWLE